MAILKKRRSTASLPQATTENGIIVSRPSDRLTSEIKGRPSAGVIPSGGAGKPAAGGAKPSLGGVAP